MELLQTENSKTESVRGSSIEALSYTDISKTSTLCLKKFLMKSHYSVARSALVEILSLR